MFGLVPENAAVVSAAASLVSGFAAVVALFAVRNTNKIARANLLPVLTFVSAGRELRVKNAGNGPALNLRFVPLTTHYQDMDWLLEYSTKTTSILPGKEEVVEVLTRDVRQKKSKHSKGDSNDILWFAKQVDNVDALFEDATNHTHAVRLVFEERDSIWSLRMERYFKYGVGRKLFIWIKVKAFRSRALVKIRVHKYNQNRRKTNND